jgi:ribosomal protein L18E
MNATTTTTTDSFGRDITLRVNSLISLNSLISQFSKMSWEDITFQLEEKEEKEAQIKLTKLQKERQQAQATPGYELEEGEVLE